MIPRFHRAVCDLRPVGKSLGLKSGEALNEQMSSGLPRKRTYLPILELLPPPAFREHRHRGLARLRIAMRGARDFSWISRLAKDQQQQPQALPNTDHGKAA